MTWLSRVDDSKSFKRPCVLVVREMVYVAVRHGIALKTVVIIRTRTHASTGLVVISAIFVLLEFFEHVGLCPGFEK